MKNAIVGAGVVILAWALGTTNASAATTSTCNSMQSCMQNISPAIAQAELSGGMLLAASSSYRYKKSRSSRSYGFPTKRRATGRRVFIFSPRKLRWAAYSPSGRLIKTGRASGGKGYCRDVKRACRTPRGVFRVFSKGGPGCRSSKYPLPRGGAPMPYCMHFYRGYAIHGSNHVPNYNASHGCIRVLPSAARWLSRNFIRHGTTVIVSNY